MVGWVAVLSIIGVLAWHILPPLTAFARTIPAAAWFPIQLFVIWPLGLVTFLATGLLNLFVGGPNEVAEDIFGTRSPFEVILGIFRLVAYGVLGFLIFLVILFAEP